MKIMVKKKTSFSFSGRHEGAAELLNQSETTKIHTGHINWDTINKGYIREGGVLLL